MIFRTLKLASALTLGLLLLASCKEAPFERPGMDSVQNGYRGTGMVEIYNPRIVAKQDALNTVCKCWVIYQPVTSYV
ncbi:MAG: hypothetical protein RLZ09_1510 [Pseudomonadota bacterium]